MIYGIPANNALSSAASLVPSAPAIPIVPEISVARKSNQVAAAKIAVFAYHKETRRPVWQSGVAQAHSSSKEMWLFGAGPFKSGSIHDGTEFAGGESPIPLLPSGKDDVTGRPDPLALYSREATYLLPFAAADDDKTSVADDKASVVKPANFESKVAEAAAAPAAAPAPPPPAPPPPTPEPPAAEKKVPEPEKKPQ
jgi:hypothetical protein